ncbi:hypothetical protein [Pseudophaeobacter sp.]|uniref:hypothetical protein n=1 Tax=Pseudophaeobacter sp. TaxID=1971739 RepID=UPI00260EAB1A|nr:hypothetical protein [Pseudophaeobacter sp.]
MKINLSPTRMDAALTLEKQGDVLIINGEAFDFAPLAEGHTLPRAAVSCVWLVSDVTRIGGVIHLTLLLPHGAQAPQSRLFPLPLNLTADGPVELPDYNSPAPQTEDQA